MSPIRVLVVEDFLPFHRVIYSGLAKKEGLQVIREVSDGLEEAKRAELLKPDLALLFSHRTSRFQQTRCRSADSYTVREIHNYLLDPGVREYAADVIQKARNSGADGCVVKTGAGVDLLAAVEAVLEGTQLAGSGL